MNLQLRFKSNIPLLFYNYLWTLLYAVAITTIVLFIISQFFHIANSGFYITLIIVALLCLLVSFITGYCTITITDENVFIKYLFVKSIVLSRTKYKFKSYVSVTSINFIPMQKHRYLVIDDEERVKKIHLPNISKKDFDLLISNLIRNAVNDVHTPPKKDVLTYVIPKNEMLNDYMKLVKRYTFISILISVAIVGFVVYKSLYGSVSTQNIMREHNHVLVSIVFCLMMFQFPITVLFSEYNKRKKRTPAVVSIINNSLFFDEKQYIASQIIKITVTPPSYGQGSGVKFRKITINCQNNKDTYRFGVPSKHGQFESVVFAEYWDMCNEIEKFAVENNFQFINDL